MAEYDPNKHCGAQRANQPPGVLCTRPKGWGTDHPGVGTCKRHAGNTPNAKTAAKKEIARQAVIRFGLLDENEAGQVDPRDALAQELRRTIRVVKRLDREIEELAEIYGPTFHATGVKTGEAKPHVVWVMWQEQRVHLKAVAAEAARAGIEAFYAELEERKVDIVERAFDAWCDEQGMSPAQKQEARRGYARHLRLVA